MACEPSSAAAPPWCCWRRRFSDQTSPATESRSHTIEQKHSRAQEYTKYKHNTHQHKNKNRRVARDGTSSASRRLHSSKVRELCHASKPANHDGQRALRQPCAVSLSLRGTRAKTVSVSEQTTSAVVAAHCVGSLLVCGIEEAVVELCGWRVTFVLCILA